MTSLWTREKKLKDGTTAYYVYIRRGGRDSPSEIIARATSRAEANRLKKEAKSAAQEQRAGFFQVRITVGEALDAYEAHLAGRSSEKQVKTVGRLHLRPTLGDIELAALERTQVQELAEAKAAEGLGPQTVKHIIGVLRAAWRRAARAKETAKLLDGRSCPAEGIEMARVRARTKLTFTLPELEATLSHLEPPWADVAGAAVWLLMRPGEIFGLQRSDVNLDHRYVSVQRSWDREQPKDGDQRTVPIFQWAMPYLERALKRSEAIGGPLVFPADDGSMMGRTNETKVARRLRTAMVLAARKGIPSLVTHWDLKCRRVHPTGVHCHYETVLERLAPEGPPRCPRCGFRLWPVGAARPMRWYDLRHTGASLLIDMGVKPHIVSSMLGHYDLELTMRTYVSLSTTSMLAELDRVARENPRAGAAPVLHQKRRP